MRRIGSYQLVERLDRGEAVEVWLATQQAAGFERRCEMCLWQDPAAAKAHAELLTRLQGPSTPALVDVGEDRIERVTYVCWEELSGMTLGSLIAQGEALGAPEALIIASDVLDALDELHALSLGGCVGPIGHGALGMESVTVGARGRVWLGGLSHVASRVAASREGRASMSMASSDTVALGRLLIMLMRGARPWPRAQTLAASMVSRASTHDVRALARAVRELMATNAVAIEDARASLRNMGADDFDDDLDAVDGFFDTPLDPQQALSRRPDGLYQTAEFDEPILRHEIVEETRGPSNETLNIKRDELPSLRRGPGDETVNIKRAQVELTREEAPARRPTRRPGQSTMEMDAHERTPDDMTEELATSDLLDDF